MKYSYLTKKLKQSILQVLLITILSTPPSSLQAHQTITTEKDDTGLTKASYRIQKIQGWNLHVEKTAHQHPEIKKALTIIESQLKDIRKLIHPEIVRKLQLVPIWLNKDIRIGACYHPSSKWLKMNNRMIEKARSVELQSVDSFINSSVPQPMIMLHEMSHALHHRVHDNKLPIITMAFNKAVAAKSYEKVKHVNGKTVKHYALSNEKEYFAEASEAYFGKNDHYPFNKEELKKHDPEGYAMVESVWKVNANKGRKEAK